MMSTMRYNKLVRDKVPERIRSRGQVAVTHIADDAEYDQKLKEKLREEVEEFHQSDTLEELADIVEVIEAILRFRGWTWAKLEVVRRKKAEERGGFQERVVLEEVREL